MDRLQEGKRVFEKEIEALERMKDALGDVFVEITDLITKCNGKVILVGIGKPGHISAKLAATFSSLGTPSFFIHPAEAMHGDLGMISKSDIVIAISYSGESDEVLRIIPAIKMIGATLIALTGNKNSTLAQLADVVRVFPEFSEACHLGLAPTSSTTVELCYGDALAVVSSEINQFAEVDFGKFHPAGSLGKKLIIKIKDLMAKGEKNALVHCEATLKDAIVELSEKGLGAVTVVDDNHIIHGIITDGDLRRQLEKGADVYSLKVKDVMSGNPYTIEEDKLAVEALNMMREKNIGCLIVCEKNVSVGTIRLQDIIGVGIVG